MKKEATTTLGEEDLDRASLSDRRDEGTAVGGSGDSGDGRMGRWQDPVAVSDGRQWRKEREEGSDKKQRWSTATWL
ncbi:hypothetical protein B296_00046242 [Ensete ventricosum]|uniref:Uncharacterized protein n=1 Tax=Ensete ventricosum TaxID=4639 RepID=A0A426XU94_ENSVE|nr:hypothetical protein B296_00046242 [Ensete ventricosum]